DPTDHSNIRPFENAAQLNALLQCSFVGAERTLDTTKPGETAIIGKMLGTLFRTATSQSAAETDQKLAASLKASVDGVEQTIQQDFDDMLKGLLP
ncbi:hypothetical protein, partial [Pseudomonas shirazica]|uniref:hypothetical protein n=1 Tax=Pseudomonas shirazica TaxID=1940636 RepID=UPI003AAC0813